MAHEREAWEEEGGLGWVSFCKGKIKEALGGREGDKGANQSLS